MILEMLDRPRVRRPVRHALRASPNGADDRLVGEDRLMVSGVSWDRYQELDKALGDDRPGPRLYYLDAEMEIMSTSFLHEKIKEWLGDLVGDYLFENDIEASPHGQATMKILKEAGAEPDKSWCLSQDKEFPDLVLEVALTSGGLNKLEIYRRFAVPEVWLWRKGDLEVWTLRRGGAAFDGPAKKSRLLPGLDVEQLRRCLGLASWREARRAFRDSLRKQKR